MAITHLYVEGLRTIGRLWLDIQGLHVLIGKSGSGKSSIIEACDILRRAAGEHFLSEVQEIHGGLPALLRQGAGQLRLGVRIRTAEGPLEYSFTLAPSGPFAVITEESLDLGPIEQSQQPLHLIQRKGGIAQIFDTKEGLRVVASEVIPFDERHLILPRLSLIRPKRGVSEMCDALRRIQVHLPFEVMPAWAARALDRKSAMRSGILFDRAESLSKLGLNLANAYHALRNNFGAEHWEQTLGYLRLGIGDELEDVTDEPTGEGRIILRIKYRALDTPISVSQLSDGTLSYLAFVALYRLAGPGSMPSLLAFDEPDLHLHPELLLRVLSFLEDMASSTSVLLATHSDRLLDGLADPAGAALLCDLTSGMETEIYRADPARLADWLTSYRGLGTLRTEGYENQVMRLPVGGDQG